MSKTRFCPPKNSPEKDLVMTPTSLAIDIINHYKPTGKILDPCRGEGAFYLNYPSQTEKDWCELGEGRDFAEYSGKVDWIITNPPWSKMREFIKKGMSVSDNVVYLTTINHYTTKARIRDIRDAGWGIKEFYCVDTPGKPWPQLGFQLGAIHIQKGWTGPITMSYQNFCSST